MEDIGYQIKLNQQELKNVLKNYPPKEVNSFTTTIMDIQIETDLVPASPPFPQKITVENEMLFITLTKERGLINLCPRF